MCSSDLPAGEELPAFCRGWVPAEGVWAAAEVAPVMPGALVLTVAPVRSGGRSPGAGDGVEVAVTAWRAGPRAP